LFFKLVGEERAENAYNSQKYFGGGGVGDMFIKGPKGA